MMILTCVAALLVGAIAAVLTPYLPFILCITAAVVIGACVAIMGGISLSAMALEIAIAFSLAQVGYAFGLAVAAALNPRQRQPPETESFRTGRGWTLFKQQRK